MNTWGEVCDAMLGSELVAKSAIPLSDLAVGEAWISVYTRKSGLLVFAAAEAFPGRPGGYSEEAYICESAAEYVANPASLRGAIVRVITQLSAKSKGRMSFRAGRLAKAILAKAKEAVAA